MNNLVDLKGAITIFTGTLPLLIILLMNLFDLKDFKKEVREDLKVIKADISAIKERLATLEERDRVKLR